MDRFARSRGSRSSLISAPNAFDPSRLLLVTGASFSLLLFALLVLQVHLSMAPTAPTAPSTASTGSTTSSATLAHQHEPTTLASANSNGALKPEPHRTFKTPNADEHGDSFNADEEAEREFASFGGDVPDAQAMPRRTRTRRNTTGSRTRSRSDSLPGLHLVDSAYSESHRVMSRISRQEAEDRGGEFRLSFAPSALARSPHRVVIEWRSNFYSLPRSPTCTFLRDSKLIR